MKKENKKKIVEEKLNDLKKIQKEENIEEENFEEKYKKALADFVNYKNRAEQEKAEVAEFSVRAFLPPLLDSINNLKMVKKHTKDENLKVCIDQLDQTLERLGISEISTTGNFDSSLHEATEAIEGEGVSGSIAEKVRSGYMYRNKVVVVALVKTYK